MVRFMLSVVISGAMIVSAFAANSVHGTEITGHYVEARTCQVYTGPCFANGEIGVAGKDAVMAWREAKPNGEDLILDMVQKCVRV